MQLIFYHIPKTGGTAVVRSLEKAGMSHQRITFEDEYKQSDADMISSHWATLDMPGYRVTWIRHPVDVFYSGLNMYVNSNNTFANGKKLTKGYVPVKTGEIIMDWIEVGTKTAIDRVLAGAYDSDYVFPNPFLLPDWSTFDFIGRHTHHDTDLRLLGEQFNLNINPLKKNVARPYETMYRRNEIRRYFSAAVKEYKKVWHNIR